MLGLKRLQEFLSLIFPGNPRSAVRISISRKPSYRIIWKPWTRKGDAVLSIKMDKYFIKRMVLSLSLDCHASMEGIWRTFSSVLGLNLSTGKISSILAEALCARKYLTAAFRWTGSQKVQMMKFSREMFLCSQGLMQKSTYVCLLVEACERSADTWRLFMEDRKEQGLGLK